jgi:hypothetical protein
MKGIQAILQTKAQQYLKSVNTLKIHQLHNLDPSYDISHALGKMLCPEQNQSPASGDAGDPKCD